MITTLIVWTYLAAMSLIFGVGGITLIRRIFSLPKTASVPVSVVMLLGLAVAAWLSSILSLVMKLGMLAHGLLLAGAALILLFQFAQIKTLLASVFARRHWTVWTLILITLVTTLLYAVKPTDNPDTPLYHAQAIHWIEEYPAVPGLGNLEPRFGSNSNWFTLNALFSFSFLGSRSFHLVASFLFLISLLYFLSGFQNLQNGDARLSQIVKVGFVPLAFYALIDELSSPGTDLPVIVFYWVILCLWLESIEEQDSSPLLPVVVFLLSVLVITFKMSGITILLIALLIVFNLLRKNDYRTVSVYAIAAILTLLPWMIRNFILTGYWLYPEPMLQFFSPNVDWTIPVERVLTFKQGVQAWAISPGTTWDEVAGLSLFEKLSYWFSELTLNQKGIVLTALISPLLFAVFSVLRPRGEKKISYVPIMALGYFSLLFWLFTAPNLRFGYGFLLALIVLAFAPLIQFALQRFSKQRSYLLTATVLVLLVQQVGVMLGSTRDDTRYTEYMILPADYARVPTDVCSLDGVDIFCARNYRQCSYKAFPCVRQIPKNVELRGESFGDGFRRVATEP